MLVVHKLPPVDPLPSASPFCVKLETWLRLVEIPYETADFNPLQAPKGKAPYVRLEDGTLLADSHLIQARLTATRDLAIDAGLTVDQHATATLVQRVMEEHFYFALLVHRWQVPEAYAITRVRYFETYPAPLRWILPVVARRAVLKTLWFEGMGRHTPEQVARMAAEDLAALSRTLGDRDFLLGDRPRSVDAAVHALTQNVLYGPFDDDLRAALVQHENLVRYTERVEQAAWG